MSRVQISLPDAAIGQLRTISTTTGSRVSSSKPLAAPAD
jgi:hypothetical protein